MEFIKNRFCHWNGEHLVVDTMARSHKMVNSMGTGEGLVSFDGFGADLIRFSKDEGMQNHTHLGHHILFVLSGTGYVIYAGEKHEIEPGVCYFVNGQIDHAIKATSDLVMLVVGNNHCAVDSRDRTTLVPYREGTPEELKV
ncbi:hypothetical protein CE143_09565 [Photorhabdus luminescens]|uniref:Cupin type-2 domain-containing protein n=1 Tax=Photorhabdus akhurstii TaxID=171438 RepID=A0ABX8LSW4_9GAMM|nr:cupin domain-containing protein [Photorhabdus akhurstii]QXF33371.1 hypothetical protein B0X70_09650 [Photorhabdus akhurstii]UJD75167.1 hypothetical protein CE143_09565 [Photorhabdus luminescens]